MQIWISFPIITWNLLKNPIRAIILAAADSTDFYEICLLSQTKKTNSSLWLIKLQYYIIRRWSKLSTYLAVDCTNDMLTWCDFLLYQSIKNNGHLSWQHKNCYIEQCCQIFYTLIANIETMIQGPYYIETLSPNVTIMALKE